MYAQHAGCDIDMRTEVSQACVRLHPPTVTLADRAAGAVQEKWSGKQKDGKQRDIRSFLPPPLEASASAALTGRDGSMSGDSPHALADRKARAAGPTCIYSGLMAYVIVVVQTDFNADGSFALSSLFRRTYFLRCAPSGVLAAQPSNSDAATMCSICELAYVYSAGSKRAHL